MRRALLVVAIVACAACGSSSKQAPVPDGPTTIPAVKPTIHPIITTPCGTLPGPTVGVANPRGNCP